jgi:hypothetical protein
MSTADKNLAEILNTDYINQPVQITQNNSLTIIQQKEEDQIQSDSDYARSNLYGLIEKGNETIENISDIARESMHPRAFEVLGQLIKTQSENLDKLLKLQKDKKELLKTEEQQAAPTNVNVDKAIFVGSTAELLRQLKNESNSDKT